MEGLKALWAKLWREFEIWAGTESSDIPKLPSSPSGNNREKLLKALDCKNPSENSGKDLDSAVQDVIKMVNDNNERARKEKEREEL